MLITMPTPIQIRMVSTTMKKTFQKTPRTRSQLRPKDSPTPRLSSDDRRDDGDPDRHQERPGTMKQEESDADREPSRMPAATIVPSFGDAAEGLGRPRGPRGRRERR